MLPYDRTIDVSLTRQDNFPTRRGFGTQLIISDVAVAGEVDADNRTKLYASMPEITVDHAAGTEVYAAAQSAFNQSPNPGILKVGYVDPLVAVDDPTMQGELDLIADQDSDFYMLTVVASLRDTTMMDGLVKWVQSRRKQAFIDSNDVLLQDESDTTNVAARNKDQYDRTSVFYHTDADQYMGSAFAAYAGTRDFDDANSAYTAKFKRLLGIDVVGLRSNAITAITGYLPGVDQSEATGHCANTYVDIGGNNLLIEGSTLTPNVFIDEIHTGDWLVARMEEGILGLLSNNARIPYTDEGFQQIASAARQVMRQGLRAGFIDPAPENDETGEPEDAIQITVPRVVDAAPAQRKSRIMPAIAIRYRYAGAVHFTTINLYARF